MISRRSNLSSTMMSSIINNNNSSNNSNSRNSSSGNHNTASSAAAAAASATSNNNNNNNNNNNMMYSPLQQQQQQELVAAATMVGSDENSNDVQQHYRTDTTTGHDSLQGIDQQQQQLQQPKSLVVRDDNNDNNSNSNSNNDDDDIEENVLKSKSILYQRPSWFIIQVTCIASLGGILFGYDLGIISGTLPQLTKQYQYTNQQQELIVSILYIGGTIGATIGGTICDIFGRKKSILLCDIIFIIGAIILFYSNTIISLLIGRIIVGFAIALSGIADVTYLHEIAPTQFRGAIVSVNEACIALGFLLAFAISVIPALSLNNNNMETTIVEGWRIMFGVSGIVALLQFIGMLYLPESPKWLSDRNTLRGVVENKNHSTINDHHQRKNSRTLLLQMSGTTSTTTNTIIEMDRATNTGSPTTIPTPSTNYQSIVSPGRNNDYYGYRTTTNNSTDIDDNDNDKNCTHFDSITNGKNIKSSTIRVVAVKLLYRTCCCPIYTISNFFCSSFCIFLQTIISIPLRRQTYITLFLAITQQLCGQTNVLSYAPLIFAAASKNNNNNNTNNNDDSMQLYATVSIGIVKFIVTVLVIWKIESIGRRKLLLYGIGTIAIGLFLLAIAFAGTIVVQDTTNNNNNGTEQEQEAMVTNTYSGFYFAVPGVLLVVCGYSMSYGPLTWLITSELYPTDIRGRALGVSTIVTYICAAMVTYTFLSATALVGSSVVFSFYLLITCFGFIFALLAVPDTGGRHADSIDAALDHMSWWQQSRRKEEQQPQWNDYIPASMKPRHISLSTSDRDISSQFVVETEIT